MVDDVTSEFRRIFGRDITDALSALERHHKIFGQDTTSAALGEVSEILVARYARAQRVKRGSKGHDLIDSRGRRIEVKSRRPGVYRNGRQFNFGKHTGKMDIVYCVAWNDSPHLAIAHVFRLSVRELQRRWGCEQTDYCARTTLGRLIRASTG